MCTIGVVFDGGSVFTFKQCDLTEPTRFIEPEERGKDMWYLAFSRDGRPGLWSGVNEKGVSFVAADSYTSPDFPASHDDVDELFLAYEQSVATSPSARAAAAFLEKFYVSYGDNGQGFPGADIALFTDSNEAIFVEYSPDPKARTKVREIVVNKGYFVSTNHFRLQPDFVDYDDNDSTYLRLDRAEAILMKDPTKQGIISVLTDRYYGETELSVCRYSPLSDDYYTQATAIFSVSVGSRPGCMYQINGNPVTNPLKVWPGQLKRAA